VAAITVQMHAISANAEEGHGAAIDLEMRRRAPFRGGGEELVAPFGDEAFGHEMLGRFLDHRTERVEIAIDDEAHALIRHLIGGREAAQRLGILLADKADPCIAMPEGHEMIGPILIALTNMPQQAHDLTASAPRPRAEPSDHSATWRGRCG